MKIKYYPIKKSAPLPPLHVVLYNLSSIVEAMAIFMLSRKKESDDLKSIFLSETLNHIDEGKRLLDSIKQECQ